MAKIYQITDSIQRFSDSIKQLEHIFLKPFMIKVIEDCQISSCNGTQRNETKQKGETAHTITETNEQEHEFCLFERIIYT